MICPACAQWIAPRFDYEAGTWRCPECGHTEPALLPDLHIVTGASGTGKTAVVQPLKRLLTDWDVFETDLLWDSGGDWQTSHCNWLRIAHSIAESGRSTLLCGTLFPHNIDRCDARPFFRRIHWLALHCSDSCREARLRARPAWRNCDEAFIAAQAEAARWFVAHAETDFDPPLALLDTTTVPLEEIARQIAEWTAGRV